MIFQSGYRESGTEATTGEAPAARGAQRIHGADPLAPQAASRQSLSSRRWRVQLRELLGGGGARRAGWRPFFPYVATAGASLGRCPAEKLTRASA
jgi:hypothetical protein